VSDDAADELARTLGEQIRKVVNAKLKVGP
jgi:hypothetical protein